MCVCVVSGALPSECAHSLTEKNRFFIISPKSSFNFIIISYTLRSCPFFLFSSSLSHRRCLCHFYCVFLEATPHPTDASWPIRRLIQRCRWTSSALSFGSVDGRASSCCVFNVLIDIVPFCVQFYGRPRIILCTIYHSDLDGEWQCEKCVHTITCD